MKPPIITINNFSRGQTLNPKMGNRDGFFMGNKLDFGTKSGYLTVGSAYSRVLFQGGDPSMRFPYMTHLTNDEFLLCGNDARIYRLAPNLNEITLQRISLQSGAISGIEEYRNFFYYAQNTTIGRYGDLTGTPTWQDNWQTGLQNAPHPMKVAPDKIMYIGNGNRLAMFNADGPVWNNNRLDLADAWIIRCLEDFGMMHLAIGAHFQRTAGKPLRSRVFLWDRISNSWNDEISIPENEIKAMKFANGHLWIWAGRSCNLYVVPEGSRRATKMWAFVKEDPTENFEVLPGSVIEKGGIIYFALSEVGQLSKDKNPCGVYSFPSNPQNFTLNIPYTEYFENRGHDETYSGLGLFHGLAGTHGDIIFVSYHNRVSQPVINRLYREKLATADLSSYSDNAIYESFEFSVPPNRKIFTEHWGVVFEPLPIGTQISLYYQQDNRPEWLPVFENFSTAGKIEHIAEKRIEANILKIRLVIRGSLTTMQRPFIKQIYITGNATSKTK